MTETADYLRWGADWAWGVPIIVVNVVIHVFCLAVFTATVEERVGHLPRGRRFAPTFAVVIGLAVVLATTLHVLEGAIWAAAYRMVGALPDNRSAMLYSLEALTAYGHANIFLEGKWQMMGALEALNGMILFGLTTAFLFAMIQRVWPPARRR